LFPIDKHRYHAAQQSIQAAAGENVQKTSVDLVVLDCGKLEPMLGSYVLLSAPAKE
jgi:hypothetical protein